MPGRNGNTVPQLSTLTCAPVEITPASARPATAISCAEPVRARIVVLPQFTCRLNPEAVPECAKVKRTSMRSPEFKPDVGISQAPRLVQAVAPVLMPAALQSTCAGTVLSWMGAPRL